MCEYGVDLVNKMCFKIIYVFQSKEKYRIEYTS